MSEEILKEKKVEYQMARFHRRIFANLIDFLLFVLAFLGTFLLVRLVVINVPGYSEKENRLVEIRLDSGLYRETESTVLDLVSYLNSYSEYTPYVKCVETQTGINTFISYLGELEEQGIAISGAQETVSDDYYSYCLDSTYELNGVTYHYFELDEQGEMITMTQNSLYVALGNSAASTYFSSFYTTYIDEHALGYIVTLIPEYLDIIRLESIMLFAIEVPIAYLLSGFLVYLLPTFFFRRGRMTIGKWCYRIGLADSRLLSCTGPRYLARWCIFFFGEMVLGLFTFGIPFIISFSLMAFSKKRQGLPDYMLGLYEVDLTYNQLYHSYEEISLLGIAGEKKPIDFKNVYKD